MAVDEFTNLKRPDWVSCVALRLHLRYGWDHISALSYADCMAGTYYDDPEFTNEAGEIISPSEAIDLDREYWEE